MALKNVDLRTKLVHEIEGDFIIPSYQRGYRWGELEINRMLDDIYALSKITDTKDRNYCLQPVVVQKRSDNEFELIDGQQRITTIYLINRVLKELDKLHYIPKIKLKYDNRSESTDFLDSEKNSNLEMPVNPTIDVYYMANAYKCINEWFFKDEKDVATKRNFFQEIFKSCVKIIWYEVETDDKQDSIKLFTRLNIGKIALTSAELVKALFLRNDGKKKDWHKWQIEIALQWDYIENELHNNSLWYFLTTEDTAKYQTKIDLVLDLIAEKPLGTRNKYHTYFYFDKLKDRKSLEEVWKKIYHTFLILKDWYNNSKFYHKIGYLIASGYRPKDTSPEDKMISVIYKKYNEEGNKIKTKTDFHNELDEYIKESISYASKDLRYGNPVVRRILLLFNIESVRKSNNGTGRFPFDKFTSNSDGKKILWSLEHIHAQQSKGLTTKKDWIKWLELHLDSLESLEDRDEVLIEKVKMQLEEEDKIEEGNFTNLYKEIVEKFSEDKNDSEEYMNRIDNLALLDTKSNTALSNSVFDAKRRKIIEKDKGDEFIPLCTKRVFLKYYTENSSQLHFWTKKDRDNYIREINAMLKGYLKPIEFEQNAEEVGGSSGE